MGFFAEYSEEVEQEPMTSCGEDCVSLMVMATMRPAEIEARGREHREPRGPCAVSRAMEWRIRVKSNNHSICWESRSRVTQAEHSRSKCKKTEADRTVRTQWLWNVTCTCSPSGCHYKEIVALPLQLPGHTGFLVCFQNFSSKSRQLLGQRIDGLDQPFGLWIGCFSKSIFFPLTVLHYKRMIHLLLVF